MKIGEVTVGSGLPPFVIAEMSANHNGSLERALAIVHAAKRAGAHAIKLQTYTAETLTVASNDPRMIVKDGLWAGSHLFELYKKGSLPWDWHKAVFDEANKVGLVGFSAPFDMTALEFLEKLDCPAYKIASCEIIHHELIRQVALTLKPMIISTGMADLSEISEALDVAARAGNSEVILLHCVSGYPTPICESNISTILDLRERFPNIPVGLSDHTDGFVSATTAVSIGACVVEKHLTIDRNGGGLDDSFSLSEEQFREMASLVRETYKTLGKPTYVGARSEDNNRFFRPSLYYAQSLGIGHIVKAENLKVRRPSLGLSPKEVGLVIGKKLLRDVAADHFVSLEDFENKNS